MASGRSEARTAPRWPRSWPSPGRRLPPESARFRKRTKRKRRSAHAPWAPPLSDGAVQYTNAAAAITTRTRQASTTVAVKTRLRSLCSRCFRALDLRVRRGTGLSAGVVSPAPSQCAAASESMPGSDSNRSIRGVSAGAIAATVAANVAIRASAGSNSGAGSKSGTGSASGSGSGSNAASGPSFVAVTKRAAGCGSGIRLGCRRRLRLHRPRRLFALELFFHLEVGQPVRVGLGLPLAVGRRELLRCVLRFCGGRRLQRQERDGFPVRFWFELWLCLEHQIWLEHQLWLEH